MKVRVLVSFAIICVSAVAETPVVLPDAIVENYCVASRNQEQALKSASMDVDIAGSLPKLKKQGKLHALRRISSLGRITYERLRFEGDNTVKREVIARYLTAESEAQHGPSLAVTPENYKFKYKGHGQLDGRAVYMFQVAPKQKRQGLFKGEVWIDDATYLRVQESGYLVKSPSLAVRKVAFVRRYEIRDGISVPREMQSVTDTWLVGKAELTIEFSNFSIDGSKQGVAGDTDGQ
ncbi:MAG: hypothetical protein LAQ69_16030 [Acidobacteriia bacterium]|nr:hypothetical protein [Terriglobia bacterium]